MCTNPSCSCSVWTTTIQIRQKPPVSSLEAYFINFQAVVGRCSEARHLFASAEDRCRAEHFPRLASSRQREDSHHRSGHRRSSLRHPPSRGAFLGSWSLQNSCPARQRGSAADEEDQAHNPQARAETARPPATFQDQLTSSLKEGQERFLSHHGPRAGQCVSVGRRRLQNTVLGRSSSRSVCSLTEIDHGSETLDHQFISFRRIRHCRMSPCRPLSWRCPEAKRTSRPQLLLNSGENQGSGCLNADPGQGQRRQLCVWAGRRGTEARIASPSSEPPEIFGHRLQTSMTRATVVGSTGRSGPKASVRDVLWRGCASSPWHKGCQEEFRPRVCVRRVSLALGVGQLLATRTPWVAVS